MCLGPEIALVASIVGGVSAAAGTGYSIYQGEKQAEASKRAERARMRQARLQQQRDKRAAIRDFQLRRAQSAANIQGATGTLEGSAFPGATSGYASFLGTQLGEIGQATSISNDIFQANADYAVAGAGVQAGQGVASFGAQIFNNSQAIGRIGSTLFNGQA